MKTKLFYITRIKLTSLGDEDIFLNPNDILLVKTVDNGTEITIRLASTVERVHVKETVEEIATAIDALQDVQDAYTAEKEEEARKIAEERYKAFYANDEIVPLADSNSVEEVVYEPLRA